VSGARRTLVLAPDAAAVRQARAFVRTACREGGTPQDEIDTVVLLTSEAVTNAFTHGRSEARIAVEAGPEVVHVEVADDNSRHPQRQEADADALDGRGVAILSTLASRWGVRDDPYGKTVWFDVRPS
jgi:anti-sigma regulatory factor (Ser/Thr protein kinase)